ncbi:hypothetical protein SRABI76_01011 [Microbacterium oxydans]|nr:hypothetical protein SRABI76_01011 [Microbacterium oxydans]
MSVWYIRGMSSSQRWLMVIVQLPASPSRHRVAVWRELRRSGAVPLSPGTWVLPSTVTGHAAVEQARVLVAKGEGTAATFEIDPTDDATEVYVAGIFEQARRDEWAEFMSECAKFKTEIAKEIAIEKFTLAELDEEEQSLARLRRWRRDLMKRDTRGSESAEHAARELQTCEDDLEAYAELVYAAVHVEDRP